MSWWDDLWLNEGFASYVEYKGVDQQHPQWDTLSQFVTEELQPVMNLDSTLSSHPIVQPVLHPDEITEIFDDISYGKGASVLRMLEFFVGEDNFRAGISASLDQWGYGPVNILDKMAMIVKKVCKHAWRTCW
ncbi:Tricorn protease-interacting factor F2 [Araneus ventricosus]|uniref:Tricorn protease-interacting factor F2 n=1 Tax=Araneus ventricosus TaxID=182803 RepID=A0A4Y2KAN1_ARAVE|nr:Tricorn protease-interacting factor F2 [Araneus ventricosus]